MSTRTSTITTRTPLDTAALFELEAGLNEALNSLFLCADESTLSNHAAMLEWLGHQLLHPRAPLGEPCRTWSDAEYDKYDHAIPKLEEALSDACCDMELEQWRVQQRPLAQCLGQRVLHHAVRAGFV